MGHQIRTGHKHLAAISLAFAGALMLGGCGSAPEAVGNPMEQVEQILASAPRSEVPLSEVAETFAWGSTATDLQRERLKQVLIGHVVEWEIAVYEVSLEDGRYTITSKTDPGANAGSFSLISVRAQVVPRDDADRQLIEALKTGDRLQLRGVVQDVVIRVVVTVGPAVVVGVGLINEPKRDFNK